MTARITGFEKLETTDALGREVMCYLSVVKAAQPLPVVLYIQGSGCHSLFRRAINGTIRGGHQNVLRQAVGRRARVLAVEKPGVRLFDDPGPRGTAEGCQQCFLAEHTLERWSAAITAGLDRARIEPGIDPSRCLAIGHSEGGIVAARVAAARFYVTHLALVGSTGPTQLFDLLGEAPGNATTLAERLRLTGELYDAIRADPDSTERFAWGHPFRRWSSFLSTSTLEETLRSNARIYLAHGVSDTSVPIASFAMLWAELKRHGRDVCEEAFEGYGHDLRASNGSLEPLLGLFHRMMNWFLDLGKY